MERQFTALRAVDHKGPLHTFTVLDTLAPIPEGIPTAVIAVPSITTWARGRHSCPLGPKPLRDTQWPWGLPWLAPREQEQTDMANAELRQIMRIIVAVLDRAPGAHIMIFHPEQLGPARRGSPATIWDLPELRRWSNRAGMMRAAVYQCKFGPTEYRFPMGVLSSHCLNSKLFCKGWPTITASPARYRGPLPPFCDCGRKAHRPYKPKTARIMHRSETPLIKEGFMRYLVGLLARHASGSNAAELLRTGDEYKLAVRGTSDGQLDSSDDQRTWVPTDSDRSHADVPHKTDLAKISWDRELAEILSLDLHDTSTDQLANPQHLEDSFRDTQDYQHQQQQYSQDSDDADIQVTRKKDQKVDRR